jgi:hypothetical protein
MIVYSSLPARNPAIVLLIGRNRSIGFSGDVVSEISESRTARVHVSDEVRKSYEMLSGCCVKAMCSIYPLCAMSQLFASVESGEVNQGGGYDLGPLALARTRFSVARVII